MKKFVLLVCLFAFAAVSCEGPVGPPGEGMNWFVQTYTVGENQWELINGKNEYNSFYRYEINIPELDDFVYEKGNVFCYMFQTVDGYEVQTPLTYNFPQGYNDHGKDYLYTETYFFDFAQNSVMIYTYWSDFMTENRPPATTFRIVLNW